MASRAVRAGGSGTAASRSTTGSGRLTGSGIAAQSASLPREASPRASGIGRGSRAVPRLMPDSMTRLVGPPINSRCSTLSRLTSTMRWRTSTGAVSITASRRPRGPRTGDPPLNHRHASGASTASISTNTTTNCVVDDRLPKSSIDPLPIPAAPCCFPAVREFPARRYPVRRYPVRASRGRLRRSPSSNTLSDPVSAEAHDRGSRPHFPLPAGEFATGPNSLPAFAIPFAVRPRIGQACAP